MATSVVFNGVNYSVPAFGDVGYAQGPGNLSAYLIAIASGTLQNTGGLFSLTSELDFGPNFGIKSLYYKTQSTPIALTGVFRMARADFIAWRDQANANDLELGVNASDQLTYNGVPISSSGGTILLPDGTVLLPSLTFAADTNTGLFRIGADDMGFSTGGILAVEINALQQLIIPKTSNQLILGTTNTVTISSTAPAASRIYTIPDALANVEFVMAGGAQTIAGAKTFSSPIIINPVTNQIVLGTGNTTTITSPAPAASRVATIPDVGASSSFVMTEGAQTINGVKTFGSAPVLPGATINGAVNITGAVSITGAVDMNGNGVTELASINSTFIGMGRNRIYNGEMRIDQRNAGASTTTAGYMVDRFGFSNVTDGTLSAQRITTTPPTGFTHSLRLTCTAADATIAAAQVAMIYQGIEGNNIRDFLLGTANAKVFTLSFWVRSSLTGTYCVAFQNSIVDRSYVVEYSVSVANTWEQKIITITGDTTGTWLTTNALGIFCTWALAVGSNRQTTAGSWQTGSFAGTTNQVNFMSSNVSRTFDITGVQFEIGSQATAFEYRPFTTELELCQRYFCKTYEPDVAPGTVTTAGCVEYRIQVGGTAGFNGAWFQFPVVMRTSPTMTYFNPNGAGTTWYNQNDGAVSGASTSVGSGSRGQYIGNAQVAGDAVGERVDIHATATAEF